MKNDIVIIGAGPVGLFTVFEAGLLGLNCTLIDNLDKPGGQCSELYPDKPIFDIPGVPYQTAQEHVDALLKQIEPFSYDLILNDDNGKLSINWGAYGVPETFIVFNNKIVKKYTGPLNEINVQEIRKILSQ